MRAQVIARFGGPEVLRTAEIPRPEPGNDEVLIEVSAVGVNRVDVLTRSGRYHRAGSPPLVLGLEGSGVIREIGRTVRTFAPGARVLAFGGRPGFYAEHVAVPESRVVRVPDDFDWYSAAALPTAPLSALYCLRYLARLQPEETVLVYAAASGVGDAAVQIAKRMDVTVIATVGSDEKLSWALENGADHGINHVRQDVLAATKAIAGEEGVEVVLDAVGGARFAEGLKAVGHGGRVVTLANVALEGSQVDTRDFYPKNVTVYGFQLTNLIEWLGYDPRSDLEELVGYISCGDFKVHVDKIFPLERAAEAHRYLEERRNRGKVMLEVGT